MNKDRILLLADAIEQHSIPDLGFNMADYKREDATWPDQSGHDCKTTACIAGWAVEVFEPETFDGLSFRGGGFHQAAQSLLNLSRTDADALFLGEGRDGENLLHYEDTKFDFTEVTPTQAARVLRTFVETGKVDWLSAITESK